jgi:hypothetical protein
MPPKVEPKSTPYSDRSAGAGNNPWHRFVPDPQPQFSEEHDTAKDASGDGNIDAQTDARSNGGASEEEEEDEEEGFSYEPSDIAVGSQTTTPLPIPAPSTEGPSAIETTSLGLSLTPTAAFPTPISSTHLERTRSSSSTSIPEPAPGTNTGPTSHPVDAPSLYEAITQACICGSLPTLRSLFHPSSLPDDYPPAFTLSNTPHPHTGLTPLHYAASRGHLDIARYLVDECGALVDMEDPSGETALHKAAYKGHAALVRFLCERGGGWQAAEEQDADGWTALHNAASRGWLDVVRILVEEVGAGVDKRSKGGYTALMNASSKGHLPVVRYVTYLLSPLVPSSFSVFCPCSPRRYLTTKHACDPLIRNAHGETAYDVAVASLEINIADVLARYEALFWSSYHGGDAQYNPLALHLSVPVVLHENQRLDLRLKAIAKSMTGAGKPKFTSKVLSRNDRRTPFGLPPSWDGLNSSEDEIPVFRSDVALPTVDEPFQLVIPTPAPPTPTGRTGRTTEDVRRPRSDTGSTTTPAADRSHFWLSDWFVDLTPPSVDATDGWQYAQSFDDPPERWTPHMPAELARLIEQGGGSAGPGVKWVRRRRWCRVMRRRLDRAPLGFADVGSDGVQDSAPEQEAERQGGDDADDNDDDGQRPSADYVEHARYLAGAHHLGFESDRASVRTVGGASTVGGGGDNEELTKSEVRKLMARLEAAVNELRAGLLGAYHDEAPWGFSIDPFLL